MTPIVQRRAQQIAIVDDAGKRQIWIAPAAAVYTADMVNSFDYYHGAVVDQPGIRLPLITAVPV